MFWFDDTARNSNLLPVKANGDVRLRSPASRGSCGSTETPMSRTPPALVDRALPLSSCSKIVGEHVAKEDRQDRRRRFVGAEPMIVAGAGDAHAEQPLPRVHRTDDGRAEEQELHVVVRRLARVQQVVAEIVADAPVEMLARAVDAGERLLVQQAREAVLRRRPLQDLHRHHLVIGGDVGALEDRRDLVLARRDLVVTRLDRHADLVELGFRLGHAGEHALRNRSEVLIFELLTLRRARAVERAARR